MSDLDTDCETDEVRSDNPDDIAYLSIRRDGEEKGRTLLGTTLPKSFLELYLLAYMEKEGYGGEFCITGALEKPPWSAPFDADTIFVEPVNPISSGMTYETLSHLHESMRAVWEEIMSSNNELTDPLEFALIADANRMMRDAIMRASSFKTPRKTS